MPDAPGPKAKPNAVRESDTIRALGEVRTRLQQLVNLLAPYQPKQIVDSGGARVQVLALDLGASPVAGVSLDHPFKLTNASDGGGFKIRVRYGTINGIAPTGMSPGDEPPYVLSGITGTGYVWLGITRNAVTGVITSRFIDKGAAVPASSSTEGYREIGSWAVDGSTLNIAQAISGSQGHNFCANTHLWALS